MLRDCLRLAVVLALLAVASLAMEQKFRPQPAGPRSDNLSAARRHLTLCEACRRAGLSARLLATHAGCVKGHLPDEP